MRRGIREIYEAARAAGLTPDQATTRTAARVEPGGEIGVLRCGVGGVTGTDALPVSGESSSPDPEPTDGDLGAG
jgi:hypothetical protein